MSRTATTAGVVPATEAWFLHHGLSYFVPEQRHAAREALRPRRLVPILLLVALAAAGAGGALAWLSDHVAVGTAVLVSLSLADTFLYALSALNASPIVRWASCSAVWTFG